MQRIPRTFFTDCCFSIRLAFFNAQLELYYYLLQNLNLPEKFTKAFILCLTICKAALICIHTCFLLIFTILSDDKLSEYVYLA